MKLRVLHSGLQILSEASESEWVGDPHGLYSGTDEVVKISNIFPVEPEKLRKYPIASADGKEIYLPSIVIGLEPANTYKALTKLVKARGGFNAVIRKGLKVGNDIMPYATASEDTIAKYGAASERMGVRILVTVDGQPLSNIVRFMGVEELFAPRTPRTGAIGTEDDDIDMEKEGEEPEYVKLLRMQLADLERSGVITVEHAGVPMFKGYAAIISNANKNRIMLFHSKVGRGFYIIPDQIAMYESPDRFERVHWRQAMSTFVADPLQYLTNLISQGGPLSKDTNPKLYDHISNIVNSIGSEDVIDPIEKRHRLLFRYYMIGSGQLAGESASGDRAFARKDKPKLVNDIVAWASGRAAESIGLSAAIIEAICDRGEFVILSDDVIQSLL